MTQATTDTADLVLTTAELRSCNAIRDKDRCLREYLDNISFPRTTDPRDWLAYLVGIKTVLGNLNNDLGFIATLLVKHYLESRFGVVDFDAAVKPQGASGIDIEATSSDGRSIVGELKTTKPYQPNFGAAQRTQIVKDLTRLAASTADHRFMFVVDADAYTALCKPTLAARAPGVEFVDLVSGRTFISPIR